jgi:hypothetical protein
VSSFHEEGFAMSHRFVAFLIVFSLAEVSSTGQQVSKAGRNLEGIWSNATVTPLERPPDLARKEFFTKEEAAAYEKEIRDRTHGDRRDSSPDADLATGYNDFWWDRGTQVVSSLRTSLVVDPTDGRIPALTADAQKKAAARAEARRMLYTLCLRSGRPTVECDVCHVRLPQRAPAIGLREPQGRAASHA